MAKKAKAKFDPQVFLATLDGGRTISHYQKDGVVFGQDSPPIRFFTSRAARSRFW
jgi:hypothetical protein